MKSPSKKEVFFLGSKNRFPVRAVLFDFDGVVADTMTDNFIAWRHAFRAQGIKISARDYFPNEGHSTKELVKIIGGKYNLKKSLYKKVVTLKEEHYMKHNRFTIYPGVKELIRFLRQSGVSIGLVSGSSPARLHSTLPKYLADSFSVIVHAALVKKNKPHPAPYLFCIKKLGIPKRECIAVENAPLGVLSAQRAGLFCVGVCSTLPRRALKGADAVIRKISDFKQRLKAVK